MSEHIQVRIISTNLVKQDTMFHLQLLFFKQELKTSPGRVGVNKFINKQLREMLFNRTRQIIP